MDIFFDLINNEYYKVEENEKNIPEFYLDYKSFTPDKFKFEISYTEDKLKKISLFIEIQNQVIDFLIKFSSKLNFKQGDNIKQGLENSKVNLTFIPKKFLIEKFEIQLIKMENIEELYEINEKTFLNLDNYDLDDFRIIQEE